MSDSYIIVLFICGPGEDSKHQQLRATSQIRPTQIYTYSTLKLANFNGKLYTTSTSKFFVEAVVYLFACLF